MYVTRWRHPQLHQRLNFLGAGAMLRLPWMLPRRSIELLSLFCDVRKKLRLQLEGEDMLAMMVRLQ
jgi:hypothetical protein